MSETATASGRVRGIDNESSVVFKGIPFAAPPTGERRFQPPQPAEPWAGVRECTRFGAICPQFRLSGGGGVNSCFEADEPMDEDCLFLNVWTPAVDDARRPTMVFIPGGAFRSGSGSAPAYDGTAFARDGVVLVTLNYRVHALGFLALDGLFDGAEGTGNLGILDQIAALQWVRENIAAFGGDPDNVTVFGESAGAMSIGTLLATPAAHGLFRRAILESGAARHNLTPAAARRVAERTLELLEVQSGDWETMRAVPVVRIVDVATQVGLQAGRLLGDDAPLAMAYLPVVDGTTRDLLPIDAIRDGAARDIDLIIGSNTDEHRLFIWGFGPTGARPAPRIDRYFADSDHTPEDVLAVYAQQRPDGDELDLLVDVQGDQMFGIPALRLAEAASQHHADVWLYQFSWATPVLDGVLGACHALELPFVFDTLDTARDLVSDHAPTDLADAIHTAWMRFAFTGNPNGGHLPEWPRYNTQTRAVMVFDTTRAVLHDPTSAQRQMWDGVW
jgi:para-nitrobenzyl esterase